MPPAARENKSRIFSKKGDLVGSLLNGTSDDAVVRKLLFIYYECWRLLLPLLNKEVCSRYERAALAIYAFARTKRRPL
jgi:hypothetical protein